MLKESPVHTQDSSVVTESAEDSQPFESALPLPSPTVQSDSRLPDTQFGNAALPSPTVVGDVLPVGTESALPLPSPIPGDQFGNAALPSPAVVAVGTLPLPSPMQGNQFGNAALPSPAVVGDVLPVGTESALPLPSPTVQSDSRLPDTQFGNAALPSPAVAGDVLPESALPLPSPMQGNQFGNAALPSPAVAGDVLPVGTESELPLPSPTVQSDNRLPDTQFGKSALPSPAVAGDVLPEAGSTLPPSPANHFKELRGPVPFPNLVMIETIQSSESLPDTHFGNTTLPSPAMVSDSPVVTESADTESNSRLVLPSPVMFEPDHRGGFDPGTQIRRLSVSSQLGGNTLPSPAREVMSSPIKPSTDHLLSSPVKLEDVTEDSPAVIDHNRVKREAPEERLLSSSFYRETDSPNLPNSNHISKSFKKMIRKNPYFSDDDDDDERMIEHNIDDDEKPIISVMNYHLFDNKVRKEKIERGIINRPKQSFVVNKGMTPNSQSRIIFGSRKIMEKSSKTESTIRKNDTTVRPPGTVLDVAEEVIGESTSEFDFEIYRLKNPSLCNKITGIHQQRWSDFHTQQKQQFQNRETNTVSKSRDFRIYHTAVGDGSCEAILWNRKDFDGNVFVKKTTSDLCLPNSFSQFIKNQITDTNLSSKHTKLPPSAIGQVVCGDRLYTTRVLFPKNVSNYFFESLSLYCVSVVRENTLPLGTERNLFNSLLTNIRTTTTSKNISTEIIPTVPPRRRIDTSQWGMSSDVVAHDAASKLLCQARWKLCTTRPSKCPKLHRKSSTSEATNILRCRRTTVFGTKKKIQNLRKYRTVRAGNQLCVKCGDYLQFTPTVRRGPRGKNTLCNGCGIAFSRGLLF